MLHHLGHICTKPVRMTRRGRRLVDNKSDAAVGKSDQKSAAVNTWLGGADVGRLCQQDTGGITT